MGWLQNLIPRILLPSFVWPHRVLGSVLLASSLPNPPRLASPFIRRLCGVFHRYLLTFSRYYCTWVGVPSRSAFVTPIAQLPFGLVLKWSDGTRLDEVAAMMAMRAAGLPVPKVISYGEHPDTPHAPVSILMTRIPGSDLGEVYDQLDDQERASVIDELQTILFTMRAWPNPWEGQQRICSITGGAIRSIRVPNHLVGPYESEAEFNDYLLSTASDCSFTSREEFEKKLACAKKMQALAHPVVFTHGDLKHHNILVHHGRISGLIDWESAGWYPDYWEFTTSLRFCPPWWFDSIAKIEGSGSKYAAEIECENALMALTIDSYVW